MLEYESAGFSYESEAAVERGQVRDVSLSLAPGRFMLLVGESGSGKSTLVRMANGLIPHFHAGRFQGRVLVEGIDTRSRPVRELARRVGVVFQNQDAQLFNSTVDRELAFGPRNLGLSREEVSRRVRWAAEETHVTHLLSRRIQELSGGESARVAIACVLAMKPTMLVLDEPFSALDSVAVRSVQVLLADLNRSGTTVVVTEHRPEGLWERADRTAVMHEGALMHCGSAEDAVREACLGSALPLPATARVFAESGLAERPLNVQQAARIIRSKGLSLRASEERNPPPGKPVLVAEGVGYSREGRTVILSASLRIWSGEIAALVGPNGAGKTTLLRLLAGLARPNTGRIASGDGLPLRRERIGVLFQNANDSLFCNTVREEVEFSARAFRRYDPGWLEFLFDRFELVQLLGRSPLSLSEGEKRRVALAAALAHRPELLLLDEPTVGQDNRRRNSLVGILNHLRAEGVGVLIATHDLEFAATYCGRWLVLSQGELVTDASPVEVLNSPEMMARANLLPTPMAQLAATLDVPYTGERTTLVPDRIKIGEVSG